MLALAAEQPAEAGWRCWGIAGITEVGTAMASCGHSPVSSASNESLF